MIMHRRPAPVGSMFRLNADAIANYGEEYRGRSFKVTHTATSHGPPGGPAGTHPGYDAGAGGAALYDAADPDTGRDLPMSFYEWEIERGEAAADA